MICPSPHLEDRVVVVDEQVGHHLCVPVEVGPGPGPGSYHQALGGASEAGEVLHVVQLLSHHQRHQERDPAYVQESGRATQTLTGQTPGLLGQVGAVHHLHTGRGEILQETFLQTCNTRPQH